MEDLKKIQEFFSKPIKENSRKSPDFILIEPAEIKYTESFGTGIKAPGVLHHANEGVFLGAEGAYIIVLPGGTFYVDEDKEEAMPIWPLKDQDQKLHFALDYTPFSPKYETWKSWIKRPNVKEATKEEETEFHTKLDKLVHDTFGKRKGEMEEYNTGIYYDPAKERNAPKAKEASKSGIEKVKDMIKKIMKEDLADFEEKEADYDDLYSDYLYKMVKEVATEKGYSKFLVSKDNPKGETRGLDTKTMNKILMNVIKDLDETIKLGKNLNEELCPKGKAYIKKRQAAGEKSSAYLSGRAVKVCKGQMKG